MAKVLMTYDIDIDNILTGTHEHKREHYEFNISQDPDLWGDDWPMMRVIARVAKHKWANKRGNRPYNMLLKKQLAEPDKDITPYIRFTKLKQIWDLWMEKNYAGEDVYCLKWKGNAK